MDEFWTGHDCPPCKNHGQCQLEGPIEYLKEHDAEVIKALASCDTIIEYLVTRHGSKVIDSMSSPLAMIVELATSMTTIAEASFAVGYCKGRSHVEIPPVFEKE